MELVIRPSLGLRLFLAPRRRHAQFEVPYDGAASLGHVVQSLAIPLTEVDGATIHDVRSGPSVSPRPGAVIELEPPPHPQKLPHEVGFLLDVGSARSPVGCVCSASRPLSLPDPRGINRSNGSLGGPVGSSPVARMYSGTVGKVGNCQVGVSVHVVTDWTRRRLTGRCYSGILGRDHNHGCRYRR